MKPASVFSLLALPAVFLGLTACQKSEKVETVKVENLNVEAAPVVKKAAPVIPLGTWVGTMADGSDAATLTVADGNRVTILQQDSPTAGSYSIDASTTPMSFNFTPDDSQGLSYASQIQWVDENTITMTSFAPSNLPPAPAPTASSAAPVASAQPQQAPFTGNVPPPVSYNPTVAAPTLPNTPVMDPVILTITFRKQ